MSVPFPEIRVGDPVRYGGLTVFPLFTDPAGSVDYDLSDEAIRRGSVTVEEVSESGSVPELSVDNQGDVRVLFLEGEELVGAKQNRVLNASLLIAAHSRSQIPVSCVEAGRWGYKSRKFSSSGIHTSSMLRRVLKSSVSRSARQRGGHRSDQREVWEEVARQQASLGTSSRTAAMSDTFAAYQQRLAEYRQNVSYIDGACGVAAALGDKVVMVDIFDKPSTCERVWTRLLSGVVLDALEIAQTESVVDASDVRQVLAGLRQWNWEQVATVGEGTELRAESTGGDQASALFVEDALVHGSVVCAP